MPIIKINGLAYELDTLGDEAKGHLRYLAFVDSELERLMMRADMLKLARDEVGRRLDRALLRETVAGLSPDTAQKPVPPAES